MTPNDLEKNKDRLASLSQRQREVLRLVCGGEEYQAIADQLTVTENTVKSHMKQVYIKLGLSEISSKALRSKMLREVYCPLLAGPALPPPKPDAEKVKSVPQEVGAKVEEMIEEDRRALVVWRPNPIEPVLPRSVAFPGTSKPVQPRPRRWQGFVAGIILGGLLATVSLVVVVLFAAPWFLSRINSPATPPVQIPIVKETVVVTATPDAELSSPTAEVQTVVVVVTSTPPPATAAPTDTPLPTATPTMAVLLPFEDNFDNNSRAEWQPSVTKGEWRTVGQKYTVTNSANAWAYSLIGDPNWSNYSIEFNYELGSGTTAVLVRVSNAKELGLAFFFSSSIISWNVLVDGSWKPIAQKVGLLCPYTGRALIEVTGTTFSGTCDGQFYLTATDESTTTGYVGLGIFCYADVNCANVDNFVVK